jgi:hypothetical protein
MTVTQKDDMTVKINLYFFYFILFTSADLMADFHCHVILVI